MTGSNCETCPFTCVDWTPELHHESRVARARLAMEVLGVPQNAFAPSDRDQVVELLIEIGDSYLFGVDPHPSLLDQLKELGA